MSFVIRQYNKSDHDLVLKLHVEGLNQFNARFNDPYLDQDIDNIEDHYLKKDGDFIVGLINDRIVGMGAYRKRNNDVAEIKRIRID
ncbi:hypothetical protein P4H39_19145 [Paenibacillus lautus]|uniref:hypothetical protein n=1 Tax=Paenibacillus lautus TaxID=1401 RepID=UPI002DC001F5|nr:hypothetical protein [Paenibacillus lautus]MEC0204724.1 hypothetical protein [Paenibacillus lautus]